MAGLGLGRFFDFFNWNDPEYSKFTGLGLALVLMPLTFIIYLYYKK